MTGGNFLIPKVPESFGSFPECITLAEGREFWKSMAESSHWRKNTTILFYKNKAQKNYLYIILSVSGISKQKWYHSFKKKLYIYSELCTFLFAFMAKEDSHRPHNVNLSIGIGWELQPGWICKNSEFENVFTEIYRKWFVLNDTFLLDTAIHPSRFLNITFLAPLEGQVRWLFLCGGNRLVLIQPCSLSFLCLHPPPLRQLKSCLLEIQPLLPTD